MRLVRLPSRAHTGDGWVNAVTYINADAVMFFYEWVHERRTTIILQKGSVEVEMRAHDVAQILKNAPDGSITYEDSRAST